MLLVICLIIGVGVIRGISPKASANCEAGDYFLQASTNSERLEFFGQFGWKTSDEPISCKQVTIPTEFNAVYEQYNEIQTKQGLDLLGYKGEQCDSYTYDILNYKGDDNVVINILVHDGVVIAGDVCSTRLDGFMTGFFKEQ